MILAQDLTGVSDDQHAAPDALIQASGTTKRSSEVHPGLQHVRVPISQDQAPHVEIPAEQADGFIRLASADQHEAQVKLDTDDVGVVRAQLGSESFEQITHLAQQLVARISPGVPQHQKVCCVPSAS